MLDPADVEGDQYTGGNNGDKWFWRQQYRRAGSTYVCANQDASRKPSNAWERN